MEYDFFCLAGICGSDRSEIGAENTAIIFYQVHPTSELYQEIQAGSWIEETVLVKTRVICEAPQNAAGVFSLASLYFLTNILRRLKNGNNLL